MQQKMEEESRLREGLQRLENELSAAQQSLQQEKQLSRQALEEERRKHRLQQVDVASERDAFKSQLEEKTSLFRSAEEDRSTLRVQLLEAKKQAEANAAARMSLEQVQTQLQEADERVAALEKERDMFKSDVEHLRSSLRERRNAESSLRAALQEEQSSGRLLQQELDEARHRSRSASLDNLLVMSSQETSPVPITRETPSRSTTGAASRISAMDPAVQSVAQRWRPNPPLQADEVDMTSDNDAVMPQQLQTRVALREEAASSTNETQSEEEVDLTQAEDRPP